MKTNTGFPESYTLPETGEVLTFQPFDDCPNDKDLRAAEVTTTVCSPGSSCRHFGVIAENAKHQWAVGWNGVFHYDHDSMESALRYWYLRWHAPERRDPPLGDPHAV